MNPTNPRRAIAIALVALALSFFVQPPTAAHAFTQGPMNWNDRGTTARYPRHTGTHRLSLANCGSQTHTVELRVDVVNKKDLGYGLQTYRCGSTTRSITSNVNSYTGPYRGHFMQVKWGFYGTLRDA